MYIIFSPVEYFNFWFGLPIDHPRQSCKIFFLKVFKYKYKYFQIFLFYSKTYFTFLPFGLIYQFNH